MIITYFFAKNGFRLEPSFAKNEAKRLSLSTLPLILWQGSLIYLGTKPVFMRIIFYKNFVGE
jgi:hypothetical protein